MTSKSNRKHISDLHFENKLHLNQLLFYKQEIGILNNRLKELVVRNNGKEVLAQIERFQNQFIAQLEINDKLRHKINLHEQELTDYAKENPVAINHILFENNDALAEEVNRYAELHAEMKNEFYRFTAEWM